MTPGAEELESRVASLAAEAEEVSHHALTAMRMLDPYEGTLYRGFKAFTTGGYTKGSTFTIGKFLSTSTKRDTAETFSRKGMGFSSVIIEIDGKTGIDLDVYSMIGGEGEVLFAPGSKFEITQAPKKETDGTYVMKWADRSPKRADTTPMAEDASGGGTLKNLQWDKQSAADNLDALVNPKAPTKPTTVATGPTKTPLAIYINTKGQLPITCDDPSDLTVSGPASDAGWTVVKQKSAGEIGYVKDDELATFLGTGPTNVPPTTGPTVPPVTSKPSLTVYLTPDGDYPETVTDPLKLKTLGPANVTGWTSVIIGTGDDAGYGVAKDDELTAFLQASSGTTTTTTAPPKPSDVVLNCGVTFSPEDAQDFKDDKNVTKYFDKEALEFLMYAQPGSEQDFDTVASILGMDKQAAGHLLFSAFAPFMK